MVFHSGTNSLVGGGLLGKLQSVNEKMQHALNGLYQVVEKTINAALPPVLTDRCGSSNDKG